MHAKQIIYTVNPIMKRMKNASVGSNHPVDKGWAWVILASKYTHMEDK